MDHQIRQKKKKKKAIYDSGKNVVTTERWRQDLNEVDSRENGGKEV